MNLSNIAWAFALVGCDHVPLFEVISASSLRMIKDFGA